MHVLKQWFQILSSLTQPCVNLNLFSFFCAIAKGDVKQEVNGNQGCKTTNMTQKNTKAMTSLQNCFVW